jgi:hypothetical protein
MYLLPLETFAFAQKKGGGTIGVKSEMIESELLKF